MNIGQGGTSLNGRGNGYFITGTGHSVYGQVGYVLPFEVGGTKIQPYVTTQINAFEGLDAVGIVPEVGFNWFVRGHNAKLTVMYRARPIYDLNDAGESTVDSYGSEVVAQAQLFY